MITKIIHKTSNANVFGKMTDWYLNKFCQDLLWKEIINRGICPYCNFPLNITIDGCPRCGEKLR